MVCLFESLYSNINTKLICLNLLFLDSTGWDIRENTSMISIHDHFVLAQALLKFSFILLRTGHRARHRRWWTAFWIPETLQRTPRAPQSVSGGQYLFVEPF